MSWHVTVYSIAVRQGHEALESSGEKEAYFEAYNDLPKFSEEALAEAKAHLERRDYIWDDAERGYVHKKYPGATAMLTDHAIYFMGKGEDGIMEISMTSGEFTYHYAVPDDTYAVWDMQDQQWRD